MDFPGPLFEERRASQWEQLHFHMGPDIVLTLRINRCLAILSGQKVFAKLDPSQVLSIELIVMLSEMSTNHQTSGGFLSSVLLVQNFCCPWNAPMFVEESLQKFNYGIILIHFVSYFCKLTRGKWGVVSVFTNRLWVPGVKGSVFFLFVLPTQEHCIAQHK